MGLRVLYSDGVVEEMGAAGGAWNPMFTLFPGETLVGIAGRAGSRVDSIAFVTSLGRVSQRYGSTGGSPYELRIPSAEGVTALGFHGRASSSFHAIGLVYWDPSEGEPSVPVEP